MKFCYVDESGHGSEYIVVAGVMVDAIRMHRTKADWDALIKELHFSTNGKFTEMKGAQLYRGNDLWRQVDGGERTRLIENILNWMVERKHRVTFGAIAGSRLANGIESATCAGFQGATEWCIAAMHLILGIQKSNQKEKNNKGNTLFVFDNARESDELLRVVKQPPCVTERFYGLKKKQFPLDQMIDVPYFADSRHVGLIQVADLFAFLLRLYAELSDKFLEEKFEGELARLHQWIEMMKPLFLPDSARWSKSQNDPCTKFFRDIAPPALLTVAS